MSEGAQELHEGGGDGAVLGVPEGVDEAQEGKAEHKLQLALMVGSWGDTKELYRERKGGIRNETHVPSTLIRACRQKKNE